MTGFLLLIVEEANVLLRSIEVQSAEWLPVVVVAYHGESAYDKVSKAWVSPEPATNSISYASSSISTTAPTSPRRRLLSSQSRVRTTVSRSLRVTRDIRWRSEKLDHRNGALEDPENAQSERSSFDLPVIRVRSCTGTTQRPALARGSFGKSESERVRGGLAPVILILSLDPPDRNP